jgi:hypothetical protein
MSAHNLAYELARVPEGERETLIADASVAHALNSTFSDTEVEGALNALGTKINGIIDVLIAKGLMKSA